ncbi:MAG: hypothetical protein KAH20_10460 [Methylococcales bacterium]|nr:hypothetical protein [Methylococcales bacterium]
MSIIVIDTKIVFSALVNTNSKIATFLLNPDKALVMPKVGFVELFKQKDNICAVSRHSQDEIVDILYKLLQNIEFFDESSISTSTLQKAWEFVSDSDPKAMVFVASTLEVNGLLWSGDKKLRTSLKNKGFNSFFTIK